ncbi:alpha/beta hydrolase [Dactylosporangium sp. NPDC005572]|uniref:alpha/beta hydrolase n=1 Tax=Dactylosporangium sp. NPDC005572 TaxID=3156889 RepID=UPI0033B23ED0
MTEFVLVPGMWLGGWAWDAVAAPLRSAGHAVTALSLDLAATATLDAHTAQIAAAVESSAAPVVLVAHSYGGFPARAAVERLGSRVSRVVYVESGPMPDGSVQADFQGPEARALAERSVVDGLLPPPSFDPADDPALFAGLSEAAPHIRAHAVPHPWSTATAALRVRSLEQPPTDLVCSTIPEPAVREMIAAGHPYFAGLDRRDYRIHALPTGHWPMFSRPADLAAILAAG